MCRRKGSNPTIIVMHTNGAIPTTQPALPAQTFRIEPELPATEPAATRRPAQHDFLVLNPCPYFTAPETFDPPAITTR
jgi:hypothetical protein